MGQSIRFSALVKKSGSPRVAVFWTDPKSDRTFSKAIRENRVLTINQENVGSKMDYGTVGFHQEKNASYLVFPKPLSILRNTRVIGIKYEMLARSEDASALLPAKILSPPKPAKVKEKQFSATVRRTAFWETNLEVVAQNKTEAKAKMTRA
ncbi:MAG: hypothetical protein ABIQ35_13325, partial [Verrucomicrobiota bacterium]